MEKVRTLIWTHSGLYYRNTIIVLGATIFVLVMACSISEHWFAAAILLLGICCTYLLWNTYLLVHPRRVNTGSRSSRLRANLNYEPVEFYSQDGLKLKGWLVPGSTRKVIVLLHDLGSSSATLMQRAEILNEAGYSVMLFDFRAHGRSEGDTATGVGEIYDVLGAIEYLESRPEIASDKIGVWGLSFGAQIALHAAIKNKSIQAIVLEDIGPAALVDYSYKPTSLIEKIDYGLVWLQYQLQNFMTGESQRDGVGETLHLVYPRPILFISNGEDRKEYFVDQFYQAARQPKYYLEMTPTHQTGDFLFENQEASQQIVQIFDQALF